MFRYAHLLLLVLLSASPLQAEEIGVLHYAVGEVRVAGRAATAGVPVPSGSIVETGPGSVAEIRFGRETGLRIQERSRVTIDHPASTYRILLAHGSLLSLVRHRTEFQVQTPIASCGVRGTTFFVQVPDDTSAYVCTCNGTLELRDGGRLLRRVSVPYHRAYLLHGKPGAILLESRGLIDHTDEEIFEQRYRMERSEE